MNETLDETKNIDDQFSSSSNEVDELLLEATKVSGDEKLKVITKLNNLVNKRYEEENRKKKEKELLEVKIKKDKEDVKLKKYKELFEHRLEAFTYACPLCKSMCREREISYGSGQNQKMFLALLCTKDNCDNSTECSYYGCDDTFGVNRTECEKKIFFKSS